MRFVTGKKIKNMTQRFGLYKPCKYVLYKVIIPCQSFARHLKCLYGMKKRKKTDDNEYKHLKEIKNIHVEKRVFIVCTGPSLTVEDVDMLKDEYSFGMNSVFKLFDKTEWRPSYYCVIDTGVYDKICKEPEWMNLNNVFIPDLMVEKFGELSIENYTKFPMDNYELYRSRHKGKSIRFSDDIYSIVYDVATVTYVILQIAVYMGFKEIYLLGCDCDYSGKKQHFADYGVNVTTNPEKSMIAAYKAARQYADSHGVKIYNATRGGKLEVFERVDLDDIFQNERIL